MLHKRFADNTNSSSVATSLRRRRFKIFLALIQNCPEPIRILDIGGTQEYWEMMDFETILGKKIHVTLLNLKPSPISRSNFISVLGDGRHIPQFSELDFDIVFSNSTIEHVGTFEDQKLMADEVMRVGKRFFVQTPNRYFPIEPHFVFPLYQFFPISIRVWLLRNFNLGWYKKIPDWYQAYHEVTSIRLLNLKEFKQLFPDAYIFQEKFWGFTKSFVAYKPQG